LSNKLSPDITLFIPSFTGGGAERVFVTLANSFANSGYKVDLAVFTSEGPYRQEVDKRVRVVDLNISRAAKGVFAFSKYLQQNSPSVVLSTMSHVSLCAFFARILARRSHSTKLFVREAIAPSFNDETSGFAPTITRKLMAYMYKHVDGVVASTDQMSRELQQRFTIKNLKTIGNPVVTQSFLQNLDTDDKPAWPWNDTTPVVVGMGRLEDQKDFDALIRAFALSQQRVKSRLAILGEGNNRESLTRLTKELGIEQLVWMPGFVDNPVSYLKNAQLYVLSSRFEGLPNALIQALCTGIPVVSTRCETGPVDLLKENVFGRLVDVADVEDMSIAISESLLSEKFDCERQKHFSEQFAVDNITRQYLDYLM